MEGRSKTFRRASASKVLPVALLSMRPLFVGANRHYSTVCHNAIRWFFTRFRTGEIMQIWIRQTDYVSHCDVPNSKINLVSLNNLGSPFRAPNVQINSIGVFFCVQDGVR